MSTHPGVTNLPSASISSLPLSDIELETNDMFSLSMAMSPINGFFPEPSTIRPFLITRSCIFKISLQLIYLIDNFKKYQICQDS